MASLVWIVAPGRRSQDDAQELKQGFGQWSDVVGALASIDRYRRQAARWGSLERRDDHPPGFSAVVGTSGSEVREIGTAVALGYSGAESRPHTVDVLRHLASSARPLCDP